LDGQVWALKADSLTSPLIVTVTVTDVSCLFSWSPSTKGSRHMPPHAS